MHAILVHISRSTPILRSWPFSPPILLNRSLFFKFDSKVMSEDQLKLSVVNIYMNIYQLTTLGFYNWKVYKFRSASIAFLFQFWRELIWTLLSLITLSTWLSAADNNCQNVAKYGINRVWGEFHENISELILKLH